MKKVSATIFESFFQEYYPSLCFFANRFVKSPETAEDIVGEVALKVWEKREKINHVAALKNYFYISVRHACLRFLDEQQRKTIKEKGIPYEYHSQQTMLEKIIHTEVLHEIDIVLHTLPAQCRKVFTKLYIEGKTVAEAAKELQLSVSSIKTHKQRGLFILRNKLLPPGSILLFFILLLN